MIIKQFTIILPAILLALSATACGYDEIATDSVTEIRIAPFDNAGELPKSLDADGRCCRQSLMLWISFRLTDYADLAHLASPMVRMQVIALSDFDEGLPAGSDITSRFMLHPVRPEISMTDPDTHTYEPVRFSMPSEQEPLHTIYQEGAYLMLVSPPAEPVKCRFTVVATFADGTSLSATTGEIDLF